jgi:hypothetical protein
MTTGLCSAHAAILAVCCSALPLKAQTAPPVEPAQVLLLGVYHFANPGLDVVKVEVADVLSPTRQDEILSVVAALACFRPSKVAVEALPSSATRLDSLYEAYRLGQHELSPNETEQLGFRLAAMHEHSRVYPVDYRTDFPFGALLEYAEVHDPDFLIFLEEDRKRMTAEDNRQQRENTVAEILNQSNDPEELALSHGIYMRFARVGAGDTYVGADLLSKWYERNIHIFTNIQRLARSGDRILVVMGSGHAPILRELITSDPDMVLVDPLHYLPPARGSGAPSPTGQSHCQP